jgi:UPF0755 protein
MATMVFISAIFGYRYYQKIFGKAITKNVVLFVSSTDSLLDLNKEIEGFSKRPEAFLWVAAKKNVSRPKIGRYELKKGMSNNDLVNMLRSGRQTPLKLGFNNQDTLEKFAGRIATQIAADSISLLSSFKNEKFLKENNFTAKHL